MAAAFLAAATRFGDFRVVFRALDFLAVVFRPPVRLAVVRFAVVRLRDVDRFRVAAAFFPAATRFGDFRVVFRALDFLAVVFRLAVVFLVPARFRAGAFREVVRFRVAVDFFAAATRSRVSS